jgi:glycosyltransferase involved in cell wall biosynthesis
MGNNIDISVIIPMYNAEQHIENAISSIASQEKHGLNYEIIVVDDDSKDKSREVVKNLNNERIRLIELKENEGTANARNTGLKLAIGEWIQFLDSDDRVCNDLYKKFEMARKPGINCYIFSLIRENYEHTLKQTILDVKDKRAFGHFGTVCNKFIKKEICLEFKKEFDFEDNCFIIEMMIEKELKISLIEDAYYLYNRKNEQSKTANFNEKEYWKMYAYVYSQIDKCDEFTKMYILEIFVASIFNRAMPFLMSFRIATKTMIKLFKYLPCVYVNQNRHFVRNTKK